MILFTIFHGADYAIFGSVISQLLQRVYFRRFLSTKWDFYGSHYDTGLNEASKREMDIFSSIRAS